MRIQEHYSAYSMRLLSVGDHLQQLLVGQKRLEASVVRIIALRDDRAAIRPRAILCPRKHLSEQLIL